MQDGFSFLISGAASQKIELDPGLSLDLPAQSLHESRNGMISSCDQIIADVSSTNKVIARQVSNDFIQNSNRYLSVQFLSQMHTLTCFKCFQYVYNIHVLSIHLLTHIFFVPKLKMINALEQNFL